MQVENILLFGHHLYLYMLNELNVNKLQMRYVNKYINLSVCLSVRFVLPNLPCPFIVFPDVALS